MAVSFIEKSNVERITSDAGDGFHGVLASDIRRQTSDSLNIGIAGAGLAGRLLAWRLLRKGWRVTLFDRDNGDGQQSAGLIAAAMLAPASEVVTAEPAVYQPGLASLEQWPQWLAELETDSGISVDYQRRGSVVVAHRADRADLQWFFQRLRAVPAIPADHCRWLGSGELETLEPELAGYAEGVYLPHEGCVDNRQLFAALENAITALGGVWHRGREINRVDGKRITIAGDRFDFDLVLDCRGFGGKPQLDGFRGVRGEVLWVRAPEVNLSRPVRLMHPRYQIYVAPRPDHVYVIGATEIESESLAPVTVRSSLELLSALYSLHRGFAEAEILESRSHCRPAFPDNLPRIVREPGVMRVNGLYRHGYLLGPALVESVLAVLAGGEPLPPVSVEEQLPAEVDTV